MKKVIVALAAATLFAAPALAQSVSSKAGAHEMRGHASKGHTGTSANAANHNMQAVGAKKSDSGTSGYAPAPTRDMTDITTSKGGGGY